MADEKSSGFVGKVVGAVFAAIVAPVVVAVAVKYADNIFGPASTSPDKKPAANAAPEPGKTPAHAKGNEPGRSPALAIAPNRPNESFSGIHLFDGQTLAKFTPFLKGTGKTDPEHVFSVQNGHLQVTGRNTGALISNEAYENYHLTVEYRWGSETWGARKDKARSSGIVLHGTGVEGSYQGIWMTGIRCRIAEGGTGDLQLYGEPNSLAVMAQVVEKPGEDGFRRRDYDPSAAPLRLTSVQNWTGLIHRVDSKYRYEDRKDFRGTPEVENPVGQFNTLECICDGDRINVLLNGKE